MDDEPRKDDMIPNTFYMPNVYVDEIMPLLTPEEWVVLTYAVRRIFGFHKRQDHISLSQFRHGTRTRTGKRLDGGTGFSKDAIRSALESLETFKILVKVAENDPYQNLGAAYRLQYQANEIDWEALEERQANKALTGRQRTESARLKREANRVAVLSHSTGGVMSDSTVHRPAPGNVGQTGGGNVPQSHNKQIKYRETQQQQQPQNVVVVVAENSGNQPTTTYKFLRALRIGAAKEFANEPLDLVMAYVERVGKDCHPAQLVEDLRAGLHRETPILPNKSDTPLVAPYELPEWSSMSFEEQEQAVRRYKNAKKGVA